MNSGSALDRRSVLGWCLYDFANSSYSAVIAAVIFPVYYGKVIVGNEAGLGDLWWGRAVSLSMMVVALSSPFLGGLSDSQGLRRTLLRLYTIICVSAVAAFSWLEKGMIIQGFLLAVVANVGMEGALVFYNACLPDLVPSSHYGRVSSWGFALGYAGSAVSLLAALPLVRAGWFDAVWVMVAGFFLLFSLPLLLTVPTGRAQALGRGSGFQETLASLREILSRPGPRRFLAAYLFYEDGVNTVIVFSSLFAATTFGFSATELIYLYLVVQMTALAGSMIMAGPTDRWGAVNVVRVSLLLWVTVTVMAYIIETKAGFWGLAVMAGLGLGTVQAASRALYAGFIPLGSEARYFGVYALIGKTSAILGPIIFGEVSVLAGSQRPAVLTVGILFLIGLALLGASSGWVGRSSGVEDGGS